MALYDRVTRELEQLRMRPAGSLLAAADPAMPAGITAEDLAQRLGATLSWRGPWQAWPASGDPERMRRVGRLIMPVSRYDKHPQSLTIMATRTGAGKHSVEIVG